jgi:hypothetical protein
MNDLPSGNFPDYNHNKYGNRPGQLWSADEQCRILLRDKAAVAFFATNADIAVQTKNSNYSMIIQFVQYEQFYYFTGVLQLT